MKIFFVESETSCTVVVAICRLELVAARKRRYYSRNDGRRNKKDSLISHKHSIIEIKRNSFVEAMFIMASGQSHPLQDEKALATRS